MLSKVVGQTICFLIGEYLLRKYSPRRKQFLCGYYCQHCGKYVVEETSVITNDNLPAEKKNKVPFAYFDEYLDQKYRKLFNQVNNKRKFHDLKASGVCPHCNQEQVWAQPPQEAKLLRRIFVVSRLLAIIGFFIVLLCLVIIPNSDLIFVLEVIESICLYVVIIMAILRVILRNLRNKRFNAAVARFYLDAKNFVYYPYILSREDAHTNTDKRLNTLVEEWRKFEKKGSDLDN